MILSASVSPMPGSFFSSSLVALLMSTGWTWGGAALLFFAAAFALAAAFACFAFCGCVSSAKHRLADIPNVRAIRAVLIMLCFIGFFPRDIAGCLMRPDIMVAADAWINEKARKRILQVHAFLRPGCHPVRTEPHSRSFPRAILGCFLC